MSDAIPPLDPSLRALLRAELADVPVPDASAARLGRRLGTTPPPDLADPAGATRTPPATAGKSLAHLKVATLVAIGALGVIAAFGTRHKPGPEPVEQGTSPAPVASPPPPNVSPPTVAAEPSPSFAAASAAPAGSSAGRPLATAASASARTRDAELGRERAILDAARSALSRDDASTALLRVDEHARAFPHGQLKESRDAMRIQALVLAGQNDDARRHAERFRRAYPQGLYGPAVDEAIRSAP